MSWHHWKQTNADKLEHVAGYELAFVEKVLETIPDITPSDVIAQYHFKDDNGKNRYIDFMIINEDKGYCLPIELDGYSKMVGNEDNYYRFNDFLERQNCIIKKFGALLRYSNKRMFNEPRQVAHEISRVLKTQSQQQAGINNQVFDKDTDYLIIKQKQKIKELHSIIAQHNKSHDKLLRVVDDLKKQLQHTPSQEDYDRAAGLRDWWWIIRKTNWGVVIVGIIIGLIIVIYALNNL